MRALSFNKTILVSLLGHLAFFTVFGFSFGPRIPNAGYSDVVFWGQFLQSSQVAKPLIANRVNEKVKLPQKIDTFMPDTRNPEYSLKSGFYLKPPLIVADVQEKVPFMEQPSLKPLIYARKEPTVIFHPLLPYGFQLYFRDRQVAHVELEYRTLMQDQRNTVTVKRKISSGNLEVDLLSTRYIERYLFMQQAGISVPDWHTVKIDLSAKND